MSSTLFLSFVLAVLLGVLIGVEREMPHRSNQATTAKGFGGIRTYALIAFFGAITTWLDTMFGGHMWKLFGAVFSAILIFMSYGYTSFERNRMGATSEYAGLITYCIGVIAMMGQYIFAVILTIGLLLVLASREHFAKFKKRFSREELGDSLKFAVIALVVLPILPDQQYSILDGINWLYQGNLEWAHPVLTAKFFNPYGTWFFVVIMAGVEYTGYVLSRMIGTKGGIVLSACIGGLISSTATTVALSKKSKENPEHSYMYIVGTLLSSCIMFIRVLIVAFFIYPPILNTIFVPAGIMLLGLLVVAVYAYLRSRYEENRTGIPEKDATEKDYESPFQIVTAMQFAGVIVIIKFLSIVGRAYSNIIPPEIYNYGLAIISGLADVDAINIAYSTSAKTGDFTLVIAATTILVAVMSNNIVKASIAYRVGEKKYGRLVGIGFGLSMILGVCVLGVLNILD